MTDVLTTEQAQAIDYFGSPLLILAGPGAGKTKVLVHKVKKLIEEKNIKPEKIVLTTFTIKAAEELRKKIQGLTSIDISPMFIGTIHSFCDSIIKQYGGSKGVSLGYSVLDDVERFIFIRKNLIKLDIGYPELNLLKKNRDHGRMYTDLLAFYDDITENLTDTNNLLEYVESNSEEILVQYKRDEDDEKRLDAIKKLINSYNKYNELLQQNKLVDFAHLERIAFMLLQDPETSKKVKDAIDYVLIDEFQDISPLQWKIFHKISSDKGNIVVVGDKNQSIYGFRGSNPNIFEKFTSEFSNAKVLPLDINFRSKKDIVDFSNKFLSERDTLLIKPHRESRTEVYSIDANLEEEAARVILSLIDSLYTDSKIKSYGQVALLFRSVKNHGEIFVELLRKEFKHIPYSISGGTNFIENEEIRSINFVLSYVYSSDEEDVARELTGYGHLVEALCSSLFSFPQEKVEGIAKNPHIDITSVLEPSVFLRLGLSEKHAHLLANLNKLRKKLSTNENQSILDTFYEVLSLTDLFGDNEKSLGTQAILQNLGYFSTIMLYFSRYYRENNWRNFLYVLRDLPESVKIDYQYASFNSETLNELQLMTVHQAKGLEFPVVIIPSLVNRRFPNLMETKMLFELPKKFYLYEPYDPYKEEENLFYVAATRAQDSLILSKFQKYSSARSVKPSEFYTRIETGLKEIEKAADYSVEVEERQSGEHGFQIFDYSSVGTYIDCPSRFKFRYKYGLTAEEVFTQKIGTIYHNALGGINSFIMDDQELRDEDFQKIIDDSWITLKKNEDQDRVLKYKFLRQIKQYYKIMKPEIANVEALEKPLGINLEHSRIRGRLDLLYKAPDGKRVLVDFKSRKRKEVEETHVDLQLRAYSLALETEGVKVDKIMAYPIQDERPTLSACELSLTEKDKKGTRELIEKVIKEVGEGDFDASDTETKFCKECHAGLQE